jgi:uncharacterized membrane protein
MRNVGAIERLVSLAAGAALAAAGLTRRSRRGLTLVGTGLLARGVSGWCPVYQALGIDTAEPRRETPEEIVDRTSEQSFPASDPPSWTPTVSIGGGAH